METINWRIAGPLERKAVVELCGWRNKSGQATPMGLRIAKTEWTDLSICAQQVLIRHGIKHEREFVPFVV